MRIELEDILDDPGAARDVAHLGDALIRFRFAAPRPPSPYHRYLLHNGRDPATILPSAPNRGAVAHNLEQIRTALRDAFASQRTRPLLSRAGVASPADYLRFCVDHFCEPRWLYVNGQAAVSVVDRRGVFEAIVHRSLDDYLGFASSYGPWPALDGMRGARFSQFAAAEAWIGQQLSHVRIEPLSLRRGGERRTAFLQAAGRRASPGGVVRTFLLHFADRTRREQVIPEGSYAFLNGIDLDGFRAASCATCSRFSFSGMSRDMSAGTRGYCGLRSDDPEAQVPEHALVSVFDACGQHDFIEDAARPAPYLDGAASPPASPPPAPTAHDAARVMAANLRENSRDPDFVVRKTIREAAIAREMLEERGLPGGRTPHDASAAAVPQLAAGETQLLRRGRAANLFVAEESGRLVVIKAASARDGSQTAPALQPLVEYEAQFTTGMVILGDPDPDEVVRREAEALAVLAPATPRVIETGVTDGRAFVTREYVDGTTWREILEAGGRVEIWDLRGLVEVLAWIEESTVLGFHGDVKPDNIITTTKGAIRLIDPTSAFSCVAGGEPVKRMLVTGEYNPRLAVSDHAALALTLIEMITGRQIVADAASYVTPRPITDTLAGSLRLAASTGSDQFARRLPLIDLPGELSSRLRGPAEALLLRALGLSWHDGVLDVGPPLERIRDLRAVLAP